MNASYVAAHSRLLKTEGILTLILGVCAILFPTLFAVGLELLIGGLLLAGGLVALFRAFRLKGIHGSAATFIFGLVTALVGGWLLASPMKGIISLTVLLALVFLVQGIAEIVAGMQHRGWPTWKWTLVSGIASLLIALMLFLGLPGTAGWAIGLLVGINLIFTGSWLLALGGEVSRAEALTSPASP